MADRGENCLIAVAGHATTVTNSAIAGIIDEAGRGMHIADIFGAPAGLPAVLDGKLTDMGAQKRKNIEGLRRTPGSVLAGRHRLMEAGDEDGLVNALRANDIGTLFLLGGLPAVGLLRYVVEATERADYPLLALGIPLSAENEVEAGDHTAGYGSAARFVASSTRDATRAAAAGEEAILVLEFLGRDSGWLTAASALARDNAHPGPHAVLVPERPVDVEGLVEELRRAYQKFGYVVVATSEGAQGKDGTSLDGTSLCTLLSERLNLPARCDKPGSLARVTQSAVARADADDAYNLGNLAVRLAGDECSNYLITLQRDSHGERGDKGYRAVEGTARVDQVPTTPRRLPDNYLSESGTNVSDAFTDWARPLIGGVLTEYVALS